MLEETARLEFTRYDLETMIKMCEFYLNNFKASLPYPWVWERESKEMIKLRDYFKQVKNHFENYQ